MSLIHFRKSDWNQTGWVFLALPVQTGLKGCWKRSDLLSRHYSCYTVLYRCVCSNSAKLLTWHNAKSLSELTSSSHSVFNHIFFSWLQITPRPLVDNRTRDEHPDWTVQMYSEALGKLGLITSWKKTYIRVFSPSFKLWQLINTDQLQFGPYIFRKANCYCILDQNKSVNILYTFLSTITWNDQYRAAPCYFDEIYIMDVGENKIFLLNILYYSVSAFWMMH